MSQPEASPNGTEQDKPKDPRLAPHETSPITLFSFSALDGLIRGINFELGISRRDGRRAVSEMPDDEMKLAVTRFEGPHNLRILSILSIFENDGTILDATVRNNIGDPTDEHRIAGQAVMHEGKIVHSVEDISDEMLRSYVQLVSHQKVSGVFVPEPIHGSEYLQ